MNKWLPIVFSSLFLLNACGGSSGSENTTKPDDDDKDTIVNAQDNCPFIANTNQLDTDGDGIGDVCDTTNIQQQSLSKISQYAKTNGTSSAPNTQDYSNAGVVGVTSENLASVNQVLSDLLESEVNSALKIQEIIADLGIEIPIIDFDGDGIKDSLDNCPGHPNPDQKDRDNDGNGDVCDLSDDADTDQDGLPNQNDNCPITSNPNQRDTDKDGIGDACDEIDSRDFDNDGVSNGYDNCLNTSNPDQSDIDSNGIGDACDTTDMTDDDNDGIINILDNCPSMVNPDQSDTDNDGIGDVCDGPLDTDGDGVPDSRDDFPLDGSKISSVNSAYRLLTQSTFGATEAEIDKIVNIGVDAWVDEQLSKPSAYDSATDNHKTHLERTEEITLAAEPSIPWVQGGTFNSGPGIPIWQVRYYQTSAWWENALGHPVNTRHGSDQLRQRIAYALSQLLVVSADNPRLYLRGDSIAYYNDILAKNAFGNYRTLLGEITRSATMGVYLTYQGNQKANPAKSTRPDENFARELIQLFTIGLYELNLDGSPNRDNNVNTYPDAGNNQIPTYTQDDVVEMAKVMTGWDTKGNSYFGRVSMGAAEYAAQMVFHPEQHEDEVAEGGDGKVTVLGKTFDLNAGSDGSGLDAALDVIFNHPNIAPFVSKSLIMNLVSSNPSSAYVARIANVFNDNGVGVKGDLKAVIRAILTDAEARDTTNQSQDFGKVKEPFLVFTQLLRTFDVKPLDGWKGRADSNRGDGSSVPVNGVYAYTLPERTFGQAPFRANHVFNFYEPDYVPSDAYFSANRLVAPETQIQTDGNILEAHNRIAYYLRRYEKNYITKVSNKTLTEFSATKSLHSSHLMIINYDRELSLFEQALDGDTNGDFSNIMSSVDRERAVEVLLVHLDKVMLGNSMASDYKSKLRNYLLNEDNFQGTDNFAKAHHVISDAVRFIATSSAYTTQQ